MLNSPTASDLLSALGAAFVGGQAESFVFRAVRIRDYPLGGSSVRVLQQGCQVVLARRLQVHDVWACIEIVKCDLFDLI